jgi:hypothetical protein
MFQAFGVLCMRGFGMNERGFVSATRKQHCESGSEPFMKDLQTFLNVERLLRSLERCVSIYMSLGLRGCCCDWFELHQAKLRVSAHCIFRERPMLWLKSLDCNFQHPQPGRLQQLSTWLRLGDCAVRTASSNSAASMSAGPPTPCQRPHPSDFRFF